MSFDQITPYYGNTYTDSVATITKSSFKLAGGMVVVFLALLVVFIIAYWKIFVKAGEKGWKSIIPIYSNIVLYKIAGISPWWILGMFSSIIPVIGWLVTIGINIYFNYNLAKSFGKGIGFTIGLLLLNPIFTLVLAFGKSEHQSQV